MFRRQEPPLPDPDGPPAPPRRLRVFSVGPDSIQLDWSRLGPGPVRFTAADTTVEVVGDGGPGAVVLDGLEANRVHTVTADDEGMGGDPVSLATRTLARPPGAELFRFAAITDLHLGARNFGKLGTLVERPRPEIAHPLRCARAALDAAHGWGAEVIVAKGDLTESSRPENWHDVADLVGRAEVPFLLVPGNHETHRKSTVEPEIEAARHGLHVLRDEIAVSDHPGVRIVRADTPIDDVDQGRIAHAADRVVTAAAESDRPVVLAVHHHFQPRRFATHPPPGIPGPEADAFLDRLAAVRPDAITTSGHTHRHRVRRHGPLLLAETGSTKDYPGTWAGYVVHEGGIVQTVRRIAEPSCIRWTEWTARAAFGAWRYWSPGRLDDRCFSHRWSTV